MFLYKLIAITCVLQVEKLKDLCLKQREEIKSLKTAILFPDVLGSQLQDLLEKQGSELKQAKQLIPSLQRQVTSLTGQLHFLAEDLKEVISVNSIPETSFHCSNLKKNLITCGVFCGLYDVTIYCWF